MKEFALQWLALAWLRGIFARCILCRVALWHLGNSQEPNCYLNEPVGDFGWLIWHLVSQTDHRTCLPWPLNPQSHQNSKAPPSPCASVVFGNLFTDVITSFANFLEDYHSHHDVKALPQCHCLYVKVSWGNSVRLYHGLHCFLIDVLKWQLFTFALINTDETFRWCVAHQANVGCSGIELFRSLSVHCILAQEQNRIISYSRASGECNDWETILMGQIVPGVTEY